MDIFETYYSEVDQLLGVGEFEQLIKRIIDLTLDSEDLVLYQKTLDFLKWYEQNKTSVEVRQKSADLLSVLYQVLRNKPPKISEKLLSVNQVIKNYAKSSFSLGPISFEMKEGEVIGLVGENGNGKTTLLRCLCRELRQTVGTIEYNFAYDDDYDLRTKLIYIPQRTDTWQGSLLDNLQFVASSYGIKGQENKTLVDLIIYRMGLWRFRDYKWKNLSSGYKMRFELARMLLRKPKLLLIDEPLANLDILAQQIVLDDFRDIAKSPFRPLGIILSSQQLYAVENASDQVLFLREGKLKMLYDDAGDRPQEDNGVVDEAFIVEFECKMPYSELSALLNEIGLKKLQVNGGTYVAQFFSETTQREFFDVFIFHNAKLDYYRDISNSTRRFFLS